MSVTNADGWNEFLSGVEVSAEFLPSSSLRRATKMYGVCTNFCIAADLLRLVYCEYIEISSSFLQSCPFDV